MKANRATVLIVVGILAALGVFVGALMVPGYRRLSAHRAQITQGANDVRDLQQDLGSVGELYAEIVELNNRLEHERRRLPAERAVGDFLSDLADALAAAQIRDYTVQPEPAMAVQPDSLPDNDAVAAGTVIIPFRLAFESTFARTFDFLDRVESFTRSAHVASLKINGAGGERDDDPSRPAAGVGLASGRLKIEMVLHTYQYGG